MYNMVIIINNTMLHNLNVMNYRVNLNVYIFR